MDGIEGTIKNVIFRQVKFGRVIINPAEEFSVAANKFVPSKRKGFALRVR